jgi:hypothetical protein
MSFYSYLYGMVGELSVLTLALIVLFVIKRFIRLDILSTGDPSVLFYGIAAIGMILYPTALGLSKWDLYRFGYNTTFLLPPLLIAVLMMWFSGGRIAAMIVLIAIIAHNFRLFESNNLWDYLIDPFITIYAFVWVGRQGVRRLRGMPFSSGSGQPQDQTLGRATGLDKFTKV